MNDVEKQRLQKRAQPEYWWFLADRWFRILEFSLILGTLYYFKNKTDFILIKIVYYTSYFFLYSWFTEIGDYLYELWANTSILEAKRKWSIFIFSAFLVVLFFMIITQSTQWIIDKQFINTEISK